MDRYSNTSISPVSVKRGRSELHWKSHSHLVLDPVVVIADPAFVKTVLNTNSSHYDKERDPVITAVIGHGLLLANGEPWKRQRKIMVHVV